MTRPHRLPRASRPATSGLPRLGPLIPAAALSATVAALELALMIVAYRTVAAIVFGALLAAATLWWAHQPWPWLAIAIIGAGLFTSPVALAWPPLVLLAGLHLLHLLGALTTHLPRHAWIHPRVIGRLLRRYAAIQLPSQAFAVLILALLAPHPDGHRPATWEGLGLIGALAAIGLAAVLTRPLRPGRQ